jgi:hypothetical protein
MPWKASRDVQSSILSIGFENTGSGHLRSPHGFSILKDSGVKYARCPDGLDEDGKDSRRL